VTAPFTPALGHAAMSGLCVRAIVLLTRMQFWRSRLVDQVAPGAGGTVIDPGCGTGSFAVTMAQRAPGARRIGLAPDRAILWRAKAGADAGEGIGLVERYARDVAALLGDGIADTVVSGRLLHGFAIGKKRQDSAAGRQMLKPGEPLHTLSGSFSTSARIVRRRSRHERRCDDWKIDVAAHRVMERHGIVLGQARLDDGAACVVSGPVCPDLRRGGRHLRARGGDRPCLGAARRLLGRS